MTSEISSAPTTRVQRFQAMRNLWDFDGNINGLGKYKRHQPKLIAHFQNIDVFSTQTITAFETLARLCTTKQERDRQLGELMTRLEERIDTRRPAWLNAFASADKFWLEKAIRAINDLIDFVTSREDRALPIMTTTRTSSHLAGEPDSVDQDTVDDENVNPTNTTPSRFITPERDHADPKKSKQEPEEPAHPHSQPRFLATVLNPHTEATRFHTPESKAQAYDNPSLTPPTRLPGPNRLFEAETAGQQARLEYEETARQANNAVQDS
ncbi:hypothetical protein E8E11_005430 [Didymella keratinophila]|nr:hypothetical protein E8E11_005430 [Didymella keratinophila]